MEMLLRYPEIDVPKVPDTHWRRLNLERRMNRAALSANECAPLLRINR